MVMLKFHSIFMFSGVYWSTANLLMRISNMYFKVILFTSLFIFNAYAATSYTVMAPLLVEDRDAFRIQLSEAKEVGVNSVSVDVWWGLVEAKADQSFNWGYYDRIFADIAQAGLKIVPIMSFHQCGGNIGDDCDIPIPGWIWQHYQDKGLTENDLRYKSEYGNYSVETVSLWADAYVISEYQEFIQAFAEHFAHLAGFIAEVNISMGAAGELRYPSYNTHDGNLAGYPTRGSFQAYSSLAVNDFQQSMQAKYGDIAKLNSSWQTTYTSFDQLKPPFDGNEFIASGSYRRTAYGRDFIEWYHQSLMAHGRRMLDAAHDALNSSFGSIPVGYKVPGIHWKIGTNDMTARSAELAAGLIHSDWPYSESNGYGYNNIVALAKHLGGRGRHVVLHFTALEMDDNPTHPSYSYAKTLVGWLGGEAKKQGVEIKGENALAQGVWHARGWHNIEEALRNHHYSGLTILRITEVTGDKLGRKKLENIIKTFE